MERRRGKHRRSGVCFRSFMAPLPSTMSSVQGPLLQDGEEDRSAGKACKSKAPSLPFSVEALISDRTTSRTSHPAAEPGALHPDRRGALDRENPGKTAGGAEEREDKARGGWFHSPPYSSPPSKCQKISKNSLQDGDFFSFFLRTYTHFIYIIERYAKIS